ncbi:MAG: RNA polymerase sigma factor [Acidimicrobiia bacterium]|nr:RNA polymerase sigma factor [Acidimicrobiia bacterium]
MGLTIRSDAEVIRRSFEDPNAFSEIFERHFDEIRRFAVSRAGRDDGPDIASQVFVTAFRRRDSYKHEDYPDCRYWLYGIAHRVLKSHYRKSGRIRDKENRAKGLETGITAAPQTDVDDLIVAEQDLAAARAAIDKLRPKLREPLLLYCWEEMSYEEIAETLGVPVGTVRSRINRARQKIRELTGITGQSSGETRGLRDG